MERTLEQKKTLKSISPEANTESAIESIKDLYAVKKALAKVKTKLAKDELKSLETKIKSTTKEIIDNI